MNKYETVIIVDPNTEAEVVERITNDVKEIITNSGGTIDKVDNWGKKRLAYEVQGNRDGIYVLINFESDPNLIQSLARSYGLTEQIIKYMTVRAENLPEISTEARKKADDEDDEDDESSFDDEDEDDEEDDDDED